MGSHHPSMRDSKDTSDLFQLHGQDSPHSKQSLVPSNNGNGVREPSAAYRASKKLETRTALQDRILSIYRESLFTLRDEIISKLPYSTSSGNSRTRDEESCVSNSADGEAHQALNSSADYDHDRDYSIRSLYLDEDFNRRYVGSSLLTEGACDGDLAATRLRVAEEGERIQGPVLCRWLDSEIAAIKENYEEEIDTLEEIITTLRTLTATTESKKKKKMKPKSVDQINPLRWSQSDDFVVRHVDKT